MWKIKLVIFFSAWIGISDVSPKTYWSSRLGKPWKYLNLTDNDLPVLKLLSLLLFSPRLNKISGSQIKRDRRQEFKTIFSLLLEYRNWQVGMFKLTDIA